MAFTANEQLMLELVNRARLNPLAEAARFEIPLNEGLPNAPLDGTPRQPLAGNLLLQDAANDHSAWMLSANVFSHTGAGGSQPQDRIAAANYTLTPPWTTGENIAWVGTTVTLNPLSAIVNQHENLFLSPSHRENILNGGFSEIGIGQQTGTFFADGTNYNASMVTQNFAATGGQVFLTGVSYADGNGNAFYDIGEARAGTGFTVDGQGVQSAAAGGYSLLVNPGGMRAVTVTVDGSDTGVEIDFSNGNVKLDAVGGAAAALYTSSDATLLEPLSPNSISALEGLGIVGLRLTGNSADNSLSGRDGSDTLIGGEGNDTIIGGDTSADLRDVVFAGTGDDSVDGGYGNDSLRGGAGNDTIEGGFGVDVLVGEAGNDVLTGSGWSDEIFGNDGFDFINGGFGFDRLNGGADGDKFFHLGIADHGSDWIQDYNAAEGDVLFYGGGLGPVTADTFVVQRANTANAGAAGIDEVFVTHAGSGNLLWALVDGDAQSSINLQIDGQIFDLLA